MSSVPVYPANGRQLRVCETHDKDSKKKYGFIYKPPAWEANKVYRSDKNAVLPTVFNGYYYKVISNGISGGAEPVWPTKKNETVIDGSVELKAVEFNLFLGENESLSASTWTASDGTLTLSSFTAAGSTEVMLSEVPAGISQVTLTNHVTKDNDEEDDRSIIITISEK